MRLAKVFKTRFLLASRALQHQHHLHANFVRESAETIAPVQNVL
jgi:hypothetical protein